jgi:hypothetical protein
MRLEVIERRSARPSWWLRAAQSAGGSRAGGKKGARAKMIKCKPITRRGRRN